MRLSLDTRREIFWVYLFSALFIGMNAVLIAKEFYYFSIVPVLLLIILLAFYSLDRLFYITVFVTPLSFQLSDVVKGLEFDLALPSEPLIIGILLFFILKYLYEGNFDRKVLRHPVSIAILFNLFWMLITSITSTIPLVSFKYLMARIWFIVTFYLIATQMFRKRENIQRYIWIYFSAFLIVIGFAWVRHAGFGFLNQQAAHMVVQPFYNDHTSYGAVLAMLIPFSVGFIVSMGKISLVRKVGAWLTLPILFTATVFSYTRAAWVSLIGALTIFLVIRMKIRFSILLVLGVVLVGYLYSQRSHIMIQLEQNRQDSSEDLMEHVRSISNVATDASNLERLNRWSCAVRMFKEKPYFGWGPGTYMFQYAPFQLEREKTIISTNAATLGNAHSEYIGPLAESGFLGTITFLGIVITTVITGMRNWRGKADRQTRILSLSLLLGLVTYYLHGLLNNFLDTDKASALFWGYTAAMVAIDLYHRDRSSSGKPADEVNKD
jgi:O-antigen ligase